MAETNNFISLSELNGIIKNLIDNAFEERFWVVAEINHLNINRSGHCYLELVEKDTLTNKIIAKARGIIWAYTFRMLRPYFENTTNRRLESGLKILIKAEIQFHELYGFSLLVTDIDPVYTLGDIAKKRMEIIQQLKDDGIFDMNKGVKMPLVPQKIAVISSESAAGFGDFKEQLLNNEYGYQFYIKLFQAAMQGDQTESSVISALDAIYEHCEVFDAVAIIRGGGAKTDLSYFDSYMLAMNVAQFPLPVITGIGHQRDESIVDMVAHTKVKTPTAVAAFFIDRLATFEGQLEQNVQAVIEQTTAQIQGENRHLEREINNFIPLINKFLEKKYSELSLQQQQLDNVVKRFAETEKRYLHAQIAEFKNTVERQLYGHYFYLKGLRLKLQNLPEKYFLKQDYQLRLWSEKNQAYNPEQLLKRGYTLTMKNGVIIKSVEQLQKGDKIALKMRNGKVAAVVESSQRSRTKSNKRKSTKKQTSTASKTPKITRHKKNKKHQKHN